MKKRIDKADIVFLAVTALAAALVGVLIFLLPRPALSQRENRRLADLPTLSASALLDGSYFEGISDFYTDRMPFRDGLMGIYALCELALGKGETGGVRVIAEDSDLRLAARPKIVPDERATQTARRLNEFLSKVPNATLYIPPSAAEMISRETATEYEALLGSLPQYVNANRGELLSGGATLFYRTDHHWSCDGVLFAYTQLCSELGVQARERSFFEERTAASDFYGTAFAASGLPYFAVEPDTITLLRYEGDESFTVTDMSSGQTQRGFYRLDYLENFDKYRVFMGGNFAQLAIRAEGSKGSEPRERLLLIKDSFANPLIPLLSLHFDIDVIDPRYCTPTQLSSISADDYDRVLLLLSVDTLGSF